MSEAHRVPQTGNIIGGKYRVEGQLGEGGMGAVYLVRHLRTDEHLALKLLNAQCMSDPAVIERFRREAKAPAQIDSDHVVRVTDADIAPELGGAPFLVMECLRGNDLDGELAARGVLRPIEVVLYLRQAARALDKAHALGIVHRDLKPENLFLTERDDGAPCVKLLDFGIAKITGGAAGGLAGGSRTKTGAVFGTPLYMAPEQTRGDASSICAQTDIWALGIIAHKLLTGSDLWTAESITGLISQIAFEPLPVPSARGAALGPAYDAWFGRCCAREPAHRFRSAGDAVTDLAAAVGVIEGPQLLIAVTELRRAVAAVGTRSRSSPMEPSGTGLTDSGEYPTATPPVPSRSGTVAATPADVPLEPDEDMPTAARGRQRGGAAGPCAPRDAPSGTGTVAGAVPPFATFGASAATSQASSAAPFTRSSRNLPVARRGIKPAAVALMATVVGIMVAGAVVVVMLRSKTANDATAQDSSASGPAGTSGPLTASTTTPSESVSGATSAPSSAPTALPTAESSAPASASAEAKTADKTRPAGTAQAKTAGSAPAAAPKKKANDDALLSGRR